MKMKVNDLTEFLNNTYNDFYVYLCDEEHFGKNQILGYGDLLPTYGNYEVVVLRINRNDRPELYIKKEEN